ncbi:HpaII family restriction endonuclease [Oceanivirga miroungae]|uniref:Uncharacterized protein n=1 Tax=Oceanivirga miroungae TaxID=1130046 RepID=A0A6I8MFM5_9FUSO|nr:HpaII family restriction endonuclease [Oceanivirga miroungae]VWL85954.1 hypothetical protein OMES3154_01245 [Oceanivirga miroungae]
MAQNRGEWSELYAILYLLLDEKLKIVNSDFDVKRDNIFKIKEIISNNKKSNILKFKILENDILLTFDDVEISINKKDISSQKEELLNSIQKAPKSKGSFGIPKIKKWLLEKGITSNIKADNKSKEDITLLNFDNLKNNEVLLGYSIKSQLGKPATILNSSKQTDFKYIVNGIDDKYIDEINAINTPKKLFDRVNKIYELGGSIEFSEVVSDKFNNNLELVDTKLPSALAEALLNSYIYGTKDLEKLFSMSTIYSKKIYKKKLEDFLLAISFNMNPSENWDGEKKVNGGIIVVSNDGNVYVLDLVYHEKEVKEYLLKNTKLDSPSSTRYDMLNLRKENGKIVFTLNLQVRYK